MIPVTIKRTDNRDEQESKGHRKQCLLHLHSPLDPPGGNKSSAFTYFLNYPANCGEYPARRAFVEKVSVNIAIIKGDRKGSKTGASAETVTQSKEERNGDGGDDGANLLIRDARSRAKHFH